jgi:hypothetical protein
MPPHARAVHLLTGGGLHDAGSAQRTPEACADPAGLPSEASKVTAS